LPYCFRRCRFANGGVVEVYCDVADRAWDRRTLPASENASRYAEACVPSTEWASNSIQNAEPVEHRDTPPRHKSSEMSSLSESGNESPGVKVHSSKEPLHLLPEGNTTAAKPGQPLTTKTEKGPVHPAAASQEFDAGDEQSPVALQPTTKKKGPVHQVAAAQEFDAGDEQSPALLCCRKKKGPVHQAAAAPVFDAGDEQSPVALQPTTKKKGPVQQVSAAREFDAGAESPVPHKTAPEDESCFI